MTITTCVPVPRDNVGLEQAAPRPSSLDGKTIGIFYNAKPKGRELLTFIAGLLRDEFPTATVLEPVQTAGVFLASAEQLDEMAAAADVVLVGLGDCGSCSACSLHVAIDLERRATPSAAICTKPFLKSGQAMAVRHGFTGYEFVMVEHPLSSIGTDELRERAREALPQVLSIFGVAGQHRLREGERALFNASGRQ